MYKLHVAQDRNPILAEKWDESLGLERQVRDVLDYINLMQWKIVAVETQRNGSVLIISEG